MHWTDLLHKTHGDNFGVSCMGCMSKAVIYITFPNKQDVLPKLIRQKYKRNCQTCIYSCCIPLYCLWWSTLPSHGLSGKNASYFSIEYVSYTTDLTFN